MSVHSEIGGGERLTDLVRDDGLIVVIIETPKRSRNKYAFDFEERVYSLKTVLPPGMSFPYDFGFVPSTKGGDGDPLDVLVLMDEPAFPGCKRTCRVIGIIEGQQGEAKHLERNDRVVAAASSNPGSSAVAERHRSIARRTDLSPPIVM